MMFAPKWIIKQAGARKTGIKWLLVVCAAVGLFFAGRLSISDDPEAPTDLISVSLSGDLKPEKGLFLVTFENKKRHMCYFAPRMGFTLKEDAEGYQESYLSAPYGVFTGFSLAPHASTTLQAKADLKESWIEYAEAGQILYPSSIDMIDLNVWGWVSETHHGTCREFYVELPLGRIPLRSFWSQKELAARKRVQEEQESNIQNLPPLE